MGTRADIESLTGLLAGTRGVLLDFDGPVCPLLEDGRNAALADQLRQTIRSELPSRLASTDDPLAILTFAYERGSATVVEDALIAGEVAAAGVARATPGGHDTIAACHENGWPVLIVSNNSRADPPSACDGGDRTGVVRSDRGLGHRYDGVAAHERAPDRLRQAAR